MPFSPYLPPTKYERAETADAAAEPQSKRPYQENLLQLYGRDDGEECVCPQLISYSLLCRWFQNAVLPADKLLYAELYQAEDRRRCAECGAAFASTSNSVKYCPDCRKRITRRQAAERMRKRRARVTQ